MKVIFIGELEIPDAEFEKADGDTMQAIQNMIGHTGVQVGSIEFEED